MGVDATIFVIADYSGDDSEDTAFGEATIELCRDYDLWEKLNALPKRGHRTHIQLQRGSWVKRSDGSGCDDRHESGYLFGDSYTPDAGFAVYDVRDLPDIGDEHTNGKILRFLRETYADNQFIIIWH